MSEFQGSKLYYFTKLLNRPDCGRAEPVRWMFEDAGIKYEYERIPLDEWPSVKKELVKNGHPIPVLPYVVTESGKYYTRVAPLMRKISKTVGKYLPQDEDDIHLIDVYSDITLDWRQKWFVCFFLEAGNTEAEAAYAKELELQYSTWNDIIGKRNGPYVFGQEITYVDFELYSMLREDDNLSTNIKNYPNIIKFVKAFESRPSVQGLFAQEGYGKKL